MKDIIVLLIVALIIAAAIIYVCYSKKKGRKCIGCPNADSCGKCNCSSGYKI